MVITLAADHEFAAELLASGAVKVKGFDVEPRWPEQGAGPLYASAFADPLYDVILLPLTNLLIALDQGRPLIGLPVFPDLFFPHLGAQVNKSSGIRTAKGLEGKRVGLSGYGFNPATWMRGVLADVYRVDLSKIIWVESEPNSLTGVAYPRPARFKIEKGGDPNRELAAGELDAVLYSRVGPTLTDHTARLFEDPLAEALRYCRETGVFPVNTVLAARTDSLAAHPGLPQAIVEACDEARALYDRGSKPDESHIGLPIWWLRDHGLFPHRNGLDANRPAIEAIARYAHEVGIVSRRFSAEEIFFAGAR
jgi:4,5-dihydroxyphthalate decarboxylase